jgi:hypothetical protein
LTKRDSWATFSCLRQFYFYPVGQEVRDRFSGGVEAFARRNSSGHALHSDQSRHRSSDDAPSSKDVVSIAIEIMYLLILVELVALLPWILASLLNCLLLFFYPHPFYSIPIQKGPVRHLEMEALQRGRSCQAAGQALLASLVRIGQAGWSQAVVACQQPKGFNLGLSQNHLLLLVLQPQVVVVSIHLGALNSCLLAQERGNKHWTCLVRRFTCARGQNSLVYFYQCWDYNGVSPVTVYSYPPLGFHHSKRSGNPLLGRLGLVLYPSLRELAIQRQADSILKREESFQGRNCSYI